MIFEQLANIVSIRKGKKHIVTDNPNSKSTRILGIVDLRNDNKLYYTDDINGTEVTSSDILLAWDGANAGTVGFSKAGFAGSTISRLRIIDLTKYYTPFLGLYLQTKFRYLQDTATGATIPHVNQSALLRIEVPRFNHGEQIRIASLLTKTKVLISKRQMSIGLLDIFLKNTYLSLCGQNANYYLQWNNLLVEELVSKEKNAMRTGPFGSKLKHSEFVDSGVAVLGIDNAVKNEFRWDKLRFITLEKYKDLKSYTIRPEDVIITIMGTIGRTCVVPKDIPLSINTKHLAAITCDQEICLPEYLSKTFLFNPDIRNQIKKKCKGAIMDGLNLTIIRNLSLRLPPIDNQKKFVQIVKSVSNLKKQYDNSLSHLDSLYFSLAQKCFNGELDLTALPIDPSNSLNLSNDKRLSSKDESGSQQNFSKAWLENILSVENTNGLSFSEIWSKLEDEFDQNIPEYEVVKKMIFKLLEGDNSFLIQEFDSSAINKKDIILRARR